MQEGDGPGGSPPGPWQGPGSQGPAPGSPDPRMTPPGEPQPGAWGATPPPVPRTSGLAIASLVVAIASFCIMFVPIPFISVVPAAVAIVLGILGMKECDRDPSVRGRGMALAGLIIGIVVGALEIVLTIFWFALFEAWDFNDFEDFLIP